MSCDPWPLSPSCLPAGWEVDPATWSPEQNTAVRAAAALLRRLSGNGYGLCKIKVRPCRRVPPQRPARLDEPWMTPVLLDGRLLNIPCGCAPTSTACGCGPLCEVVLDGPVYDVVEVKQDGVVVVSGAYRVDDRHLLVRTDGACWPDCQDLALPDTQPGTWSVTYRLGLLPDEAGEMALTALAVELDKACRDDATCKLPRRAVEIVRDGVTYSLDQETTLFNSGRTGIARVDMWLATVNPYALRSSMAVYSPDTVRSRRQTYPTPTLPP